MHDESNAMYGVEYPMICRLCLLYSDYFINIFSPYDNDGFLLWKIIEELIYSEVSQEDGLPPTICTVCMRKLMDFKHFKSTCIESRIEFLKHQPNHGSVVPAKMEEALFDDQVNESQSISGGECSERDPLGSEDDSNSMVPAKIEEKFSADPLDQIEPSDDDVWSEHDPLGSVDDANSQVLAKREMYVFDDLVDRGQPTNVDEHLEQDPLGGLDDSNSQVPNVSGRLYLEESQYPNAEDGNSTNLHFSGSETLGMTGSLQCRRETQDSDQSQKSIRRCSFSWKNQLKAEEQEPIWIGFVPPGDGVDMTAETPREHINCGERQLEHHSEKESHRNQEETSMSQCLFNDHVSNITPEVSQTFQGDQKNVEGWKKLDKLEDVKISSNPIDLHRISNSGFPLTCHVCNKAFIEEVHLTIHIRSSHLDKFEFLCDLCDKVFDQKSMLLKHINSHKRAKSCVCIHCRMRLDSLYFLREHVLLMHKEKKPGYTCVQCLSTFTRKHRLKSHLASPKGSYACDVCPKSFSWLCLLKMHRREHRDRKLHPCSVCGKTFRYKYDLGRHIAIHATSKPYPCNVCSKRFGCSGNLRAHMVVHTKEKPYSCKVCSKEFGFKTSLSVHLRRHTGEKPFSCHVCARTFAHRSALNNHVLTHQKDRRRYQCKLCTSNFSRASLLTEHMVLHDKECAHCCAVCAKTFTRRHSLLEHVATVHKGKRPHSCAICTKAFARKTLLERHVASVHEGKKPHSCNICFQAFSGKMNLQRHLKVHTGLKPFKCAHCPFTARNKSNLKAHILSVHRYLDDELAVTHGRKKIAHSCATCSKTFSCKSHLQMHMMVHTGLKPFECAHCPYKANRKAHLRRHILTKMHKDVRLKPPVPQ